MIDALERVARSTRNSRQRAVLLRQAEMIMRAAETEVDEPNDLADIRRRFDQLMDTCRTMDEPVG
jgi:uncharacterized membrane protein